jgi:hypothetical protein
MPAAIEKNAVAEEMSRMRGRGLEAHYNISRTLRACSLLFAIIRWPVPKKKDAHTSAFPALLVMV